MNLCRPKSTKIEIMKILQSFIKQFQELGLITNYWEINFAKGRLKYFLQAIKFQRFPFQLYFSFPEFPNIVHKYVTHCLDMYVKLDLSAFNVKSRFFRTRDIDN